MNSRIPDQTQPTAEVRQLERVAQAKGLYEDYCQRERLSLRAAWDLGKLLAEIKEVAGHGNWLKELEKTKVPQQTASKCMRLAQITHSVVCSFNSVEAALESLKETEPEAPTVAAGEESFLQPPPPPPPPRPAKIEMIFCKRCIRVQHPVKDCPQCQQAREHAKRGSTKSGGKSSGSGNRAKRRVLALRTKEGAFDWKAWESHFGFVRLGPAIMAETFGKEKHPRIEPIVRKIDEVYLQLERLLKELKQEAANDPARVA